MSLANFLQNSVSYRLVKFLIKVNKIGLNVKNEIVPKESLSYAQHFTKSNPKATIISCPGLAIH